MGVGQGHRNLPLIQVEDVTKVYGGRGRENEVRALDGVSLSIGRGEWVAVIGKSGSGKSTLMNLLGCLDTPSSGNYRLEGQDVSSLSDAQLSHIRNQKIGFVFQGYNLIPGISALENVEMPLFYRGLSRPLRQERAREALINVGLGDRLSHTPAQMSGGQQQRVAIARAICQDPAIILADEPTGNLDTGSGREVMAILKGLSTQGRTLVLITHDLEIAKNAGRIIRIADGKISSDYVNMPAS